MSNPKNSITQALFLIAAAACSISSATAQEPINPVYRVVALDAIPFPGEFWRVHLREDNTILLIDNTQCLVGGLGIPWTPIPELANARIGGVNSSGQICGTLRQKDNSIRPFIASPNAQGIYDDIQFFPTDGYSNISDATYGMDIADDGTVVGANSYQPRAALLWPPKATEPSLITSQEPNTEPVGPEVISPDGSIILGDAFIGPNGQSRTFIASNEADATVVGALGLGYEISYRGVSNTGLLLLDTATDTFDGNIDLWQIDGTSFQHKRTIGYAGSFGLLWTTPRMSPAGRCLAYTDRLVTWFDDGSSDGAVIPIADRLWTDNPPQLFFNWLGGDINDAGVIAIGASGGFVLLIPTCRADVNADGNIDLTDFDAWIAAYQSNSRRADQNGDGAITPADFTAWIAGYNDGCNLP